MASTTAAMPRVVELTRELVARSPAFEKAMMRRFKDVPPEQQSFTAINAELSKAWKPIIERKPAPADADDWKDVTDKMQYLER